MTDQAFFQAIASFGPAQTAPRSTSVTPQSAVDLCGTYKKVRPILEGILPLLKAIPGFGPQVAAAIQTLITAADGICGVGGAGAATVAGAAPCLHAAFFSALTQFQPNAAGVALSAGPTAFPGDVCKVYAGIKPILEGILPFLSLIPGIGTGVGAAITALMTVLDTVCPSS
jgi:hypothetical protein